MPADGEYTFWTHVLHDKKKREKSLRDDRRLTGSAKNLNITVLLDTINVSIIGHYQCQFYRTLSMPINVEHRRRVALTELYPLAQHSAP